MTFKAHGGTIRSIAWLADDTGFFSSALDTTIYYWTLNPKEGQQNPVWGLTVPSVDFTCLKVFKPDGDKTSPSVFATGQDKCIHEIKDAVLVRKFEQSINLN
jgi:WD40 repeat protein